MRLQILSAKVTQELSLEGHARVTLPSSPLNPVEISIQKKTDLIQCL